MTMFGAISSKTFIPNFMRDPDSEDNSNSLTVTYCFKKFVLVTAKFAEMPTAWATTLGKANDFVLPYLAQLGSFSSEYAKIGAPFSNAFAVIGLGEGWCSINYFLNGDFYEDIKESRMFSVIGQILLIPVNLIGTAQFLQAADLANTLGGTRVFYYVEKVTNLRWINAIPGLASGAAWLSQEGWINVFATFGGLADGCLLGVFTSLGLHGLYQISTHSGLAHKSKEKLKQAVSKIIGEEGLKDIDLRTQSLINLTNSFPVKPESLEKLGKLKAKWLKHESDVTQGKRDVVAAVSELMLKGALMAGVTSLPVLAALGSFAFVAVGTSIYYRSTSNNPDVLLR